MDERRLELKVGALLLAGLAGLVVLLWLMGQISFSRGPALTVVLSHTGNVAQGAPMKLGGVPIGKVEEISLDPDRRAPDGESLPVTMLVSIGDHVFRSLHADARVIVATRGPFGEAYLEISPGSPGAPPLQKGATIRATEPLRLDEIAGRMGRMLEAATRSLEENPQVVGQLLTGLSKLSNNAGDVVGENRQELKALIGNLAAASKEVQGLAQLARAQLSPGGDTATLIDNAAASSKLLRKDLPGISQNAAQALAGLAALSSGLTAEDGARLKAAIAQYSAAGQKLEQVATRADQILARIEAGQGTLGGFSKDPQLYEDLRALVADLRQHPWKILWK